MDRWISNFPSEGSWTNGYGNTTLRGNKTKKWWNTEIHRKSVSLKTRIQEPVVRSKTCRRIVQTVTSHVKFQSPKIKK